MQEQEIKINPEVAAQCDKMRAYLKSELPNGSLVTSQEIKYFGHVSAERLESVFTSSGRVESVGIKLEIYVAESGIPTSVWITPREAHQIGKQLQDWANDLAYKHADFLIEKENCKIDLGNQDADK